MRLRRRTSARRRARRPAPRARAPRMVRRRARRQTEALRTEDVSDVSSVAATRRTPTAEGESERRGKSLAELPRAVHPEVTGLVREPESYLDHARLLCRPDA